MQKLSETECTAIMQNGDAANLTTGTAALILTQSWCAQWKAMKAYLSQVEAACPGAKIFYVEYDIEEWKTLDNGAFMGFKENHFNNRQVPYVRYYRDSVCTGESNYVSREGFIAKLTAAI
ncbi:MAG: hypothetical protein LBJ31_00215 [Treponema sp.]|jgi:hypothetical protein|nr:hypothetical protein [Treponema sp.]